MNPLSRRHVVRAAALAVLSAVGFSVVGGLRRFLAGREEGARLSRKVLEAEASVSRKRAVLARQTDDILETEARRQLGLIGEGEIEFRFLPSADGGPDKVETSFEGS